VPPLPWGGSHTSPPGGAAWGASPRALRPAHPSTRAAMRAGTGRCRPTPPRPPARPRRAPPRTCARVRHAVNGPRPHAALAMPPTASRDALAPRPRPNRVPPLDYPARCAGRDGSATGGLRWHQPWGHGSHPCSGKAGGREARDAGAWTVAFGRRTRGRWRERHRRREEAEGRRPRGR
jgi:hypothetical protein